MIASLLRLEAFFALLAAYALVHASRTPIAFRLFGGPGKPKDISKAIPPETLARATAATRRVNRLANQLPWHSSCLVLAVAGRLVLIRRGIDNSVVRFGVSRPGGQLSAHAWLILGERILLGEEGIAESLPLADLG